MRIGVVNAHRVERNEEALLPMTGYLPKAHKSVAVRT
jgi:hypothetical protein